jgi:hypothetical protein
MPPGYQPTATAVSAMRAGSEASIFTVFKNPAPLPEYIERGLVFAGNPDTVMKGKTLFVREVDPRLKELPESG